MCKTFCRILYINFNKMKVHLSRRQTVYLTLRFLQQIPGKADVVGQMTLEICLNYSG